MEGPTIIARSLSQAGVIDRSGRHWAYHSRSDRHSKITCWSVLFDLLEACAPLRKQAAEGVVAFGINHEMIDFQQSRKKNLDLVICTPASKQSASLTMAELVERYGITLSQSQANRLSSLPPISQAPVGSVLVALESKACMTAHQRALPRLYDELNSSHLTVHAASAHAIAAGIVLVNASERFLSPDLNKSNGSLVWSQNKQPHSARITLEKIRQLPRRTRTDQTGFDALGAIVIDFTNAGDNVTLPWASPAPAAGDVLSYDSAIERISNLFGTRFAQLG